MSISESKCRRQAKALGCKLVKSRRREGADNLGGFMIVDISDNFAVAGHRYDFDLQDVADWLAGMEAA